MLPVDYVLKENFFFSTSVFACYHWLDMKVRSQLGKSITNPFVVPWGYVKFTETNCIKVA